MARLPTPGPLSIGRADPLDQECQRFCLGNTSTGTPSPRFAIDCWLLVMMITWAGTAAG